MLVMSAVLDGECIDKEAKSSSRIRSLVTSTVNAAPTRGVTVTVTKLLVRSRVTTEGFMGVVCSFVSFGSRVKV